MDVFTLLEVPSRVTTMIRHPHPEDTMATTRLVRIALPLGLALACASAAQAQGASVELPPGLFGHLDQHKTHCDAHGCGPTAVVNSFVYLQTYYAPLSNLPKSPSPAPSIVTDPSEQGLIKLANDLGGLMGCSADCDTDNDKLFDGKNKYLNAPGRTGGWVPKTDWNNSVTWRWITDSLHDGVDIELLVNDGNLGHYITLTGYTWKDTNHNGKQDNGETTISFIDPDDGSFMQKSLNVDANGGMTITGYDLDPNAPGVPDVSITDGFSEKLVPSPVPEPGTWGLMGVGLLGLVWRRRAVR
jgi:hypothetical protein